MLAATTVGTARSMSPSARMNSPHLLLSAEARVAVPAFRDTLEHRVTAGDDLIVTLPRTLSRRPVTDYTIVRAPAMSWLVDRSLLWRTHPQDVGRHALLVEAAFADAAPDTLTILVEVTE